ncbi:MAG TPA: AraC family transcriptional regulator [Actinobacteria bacterium]|jgi:AraC-like DNA-binding protein|nr:AraC family transcriptional regulator [Actinomycetota bacterium]
MAKVAGDSGLSLRSERVVETYVGRRPPHEIIPPHPQHSLRSLRHDYPSPICGWHSHPEYEIHLISKTRGSVIVGDHIGTFEPGQISIMGPNLPHDWVSDIEPGTVSEDRDWVIQFTDEWVRGCMLLIPELTEVTAVLDLSLQGLSLTGPRAEVAASIMQECVQASGVRQVGLLFELLWVFAEAPSSERVLLAPQWVDPSSDAQAKQTVEAGVDYIFENLTGTIRLSTAASLAHMSEPSFSRYFKRASGVTFSDMVKKLRIAHACRLLTSTSDPVAAVAAASGYTNLANFNRQFRYEVGMTPREYRALDTQERPRTPVPSRGLKASIDLHRIS